MILQCSFACETALRIVKLIHYLLIDSSLGIVRSVMKVCLISKAWESFRMIPKNVVLMTVMLAVALYVGIPVVFETIGAPESIWYGIFAGIIGAIIGAITSFSSEKKGPIDNWKTWEIVSNSKIITLLILVFTFSPYILKGGEIFGIDSEIPFIFYMYWMCGLCSFFLMILYAIFAPKIYKYTSYNNFISREGTIYSLRDDAHELMIELQKKKEESSLKDYEEKDYENDISIIRNIAEGKEVDEAKSFYVFKERSKYSKPASRFFVVLFILIPVYILPVTIFINIVTVASAAAKKVEKEGSIYKAVVSSDKDGNSNN